MQRIPKNGFLPSTGKIWGLDLADEEDVRIDTGIEEGDEVSPFYDPMIAKVIVHGDSREAALARLSDILERSVVAGPRTNAAFLAALTRHEDFVGGRFDTSFIDTRLAGLTALDEKGRKAAAGVALQHMLTDRHSRMCDHKSDRTNEHCSAWDIHDGFQLGGARVMTYPLQVDGALMDMTVQFGPSGIVLEKTGRGPSVQLVEAPHCLYAVCGGRQYEIATPDYDHEDEGAAGAIGAPMHGKVVAVFVEEGQSVAKGDRLFIVEAMKMEHSVTAPIDGVISAVAARVGDQVEEGFAVVSLEADEE